jgi:predicted transposase YbfD/YdcC
LNDFVQKLGWPGVRQTFQITREVAWTDRTTGEQRTSREVVYGLTSLSRKQADAAKLLSLNRGHWTIENRVFYVRDVTFGEDRCRLRTRSAPINLSRVRSAAITWFRAHGHRNLAAAVRQSAWDSSRLFARLGIMKQ